jgi:hypothetical protein
MSEPGKQGRNDVSAVVLTIGEAQLPRALESLTAQTLSLEQVIVVKDVSPFFRAMNEGAGQVRTPFFVQVDADMILDPHCVETLREAMQQDTGVAVAHLRDPLAGPVVGIKLFRTECFQLGGFPDRISPDTDFIAAIQRRGWTIQRVGYPENGSSRETVTLGEHRPDYTPGYTFRKYLLEGRRLRYRANPGAMRWQFGILEQSRHPLATLAQLALAHGFFQPGVEDRLKPDFSPEERRAAELETLLVSDHRVDAWDGLLPPAPTSRLREIFRGHVQAGRELARRGAGANVREVWSTLHGAGRDWHQLVAKLGFGHGLLTLTAESAHPREEERAVELFLAFPGRSMHWSWALPLIRAAKRLPGLGNRLWRRW